LFEEKHHNIYYFIVFKKVAISLVTNYLKIRLMPLAIVSHSAMKSSLLLI